MAERQDANCKVGFEHCPHAMSFYKRLLAALMVGLVLGFGVPAFSQDQKSLEACVQQYVKRWSKLCEPADVLAQGVAHACATAPVRPLRANADTQERLRYDLDHAVHAHAYRSALVMLLNTRTSDPPPCGRN